MEDINQGDGKNRESRGEWGPIATEQWGPESTECMSLEAAPGLPEHSSEVQQAEDRVGGAADVSVK